MPETRVKVYRTEEERRTDEAAAVSRGWSVVSREQQADGSLKVSYRYGNEWDVPPAPRTAPAAAPPPPTVHYVPTPPPPAPSGGGFGQSVGQGFGWGCGCLLLIVVVVVILGVIGAGGR